MYNFRYSLFLLFLTFVCSSTYSFGFNKFDNNSKYFWSQISLFGDAFLVQNGSFIQLSGSLNSSSGRVVYKKPIKLSLGNSRIIPSFGSYFVFCGGFDIAFELFAFRSNVDRVSGELGGKNHVRINVGSKVGSNGEKNQCWIDFESSSKRIEVRMSRLGEGRPVNPSHSRQVDLVSMFRDDEVVIGLVSSTANATRVCRLYSWSFKLRQVPSWMHSQPLDPQGFKKDAETVVVANTLRKRGDCIMRVFTALVFGTGCGELGAFIVLCVCNFCVAKKPVVPFDYDKVQVIVIDKPGTSKN